VDEISAAAEQDLIVVGFGTHDAIGAGHAPRAWNVLNDDLLANGFAHVLREQPSNYVGRPASRIGHDHRNRPCRPILGMCYATGDQESWQDNPHSTEFHGKIYRLFIARGLPLLRISSLDLTGTVLGLDGILWRL